VQKQMKVPIVAAKDPVPKNGGTVKAK